ncbi:MAG: PHP domain-containing protein [Deltaproteobacteria bacterium]|nr:PHP domain-containing protein [Deltaproteobacteria bacterium]
MSSYIDLHTHTTASDGSCTPGELVWLARDASLVAVAITDHDTVAGCAEATAAGPAAGVEVVCGVEVSAQSDLPGQLHLLGLFVDPEHPRLGAWLEWIRAARHRRNPKIVERLKALGIPVEMAEVEARATSGEVVGRPHIAQVLLDKGVVPSVTDAFLRYLAKGAPAYVDRERTTAAEAFAIIHAAGGLAVLAHPQLCRARDWEELARFVRGLKELGLDGMEVHYPTLTPDEQARLAALASKLGLLAGGGSDFHGSVKPGLQLGTGFGSLRVPAALLNAMHAARRR